MPKHLRLLMFVSFMCRMQLLMYRLAARCQVERDLRSSHSEYGDGVFRSVTVTPFTGQWGVPMADSDHISAAVEGAMTVVILLSVKWEGLDTHANIQTHTLSL